MSGVSMGGFPLGTPSPTEGNVRGSAEPVESKRWHPLTYAPGDLEAFLKSNVSGREKLPYAGMWETNNSNTKQSTWGKVQNAQGEDLTALLTQYQAWRKKRAQSQVERRSYLEGVAAAPGRESTILAGQRANTVLGG